MEKIEIGTCEWFGSNGQSYGYIKRENAGQIYVHFKHISSKNLRDPKFKELRKGDVVSFIEILGHRDSGSQADKVEILIYGTNNTES